MRKNYNIQDLIDGILNHKPIILSKVITLIENREPIAQEILKKLYPYTGKAYIIGITGPPGVGKSSLIDVFISYLRKQNLTIGVIAIDPSSPYSGGAILGDRVRMTKHTMDKDVFIRSMASRGHTGGIALSTRDAVKILDIYGKDIIIVETTGVGQTEIGITEIADTTILVLNPETGDEIQAIKAGIMEIADIFVVNKSDLPGAILVKKDVESSLNLIESSNNYRQPVILTNTLKDGEGIEKLWNAVIYHKEYQIKSGLLDIRRNNSIKYEIETLLKIKIYQYIHNKLQNSNEFYNVISQINQKLIDPWTGTDNILKIFLKDLFK